MSTNLFGLTQGQLRAFAVDLGHPAYLGNQLALWIYKRRAPSFEVMSDLSVSVRRQLQELCSLERQEPSRVDESRDGTKKYLFPVNGKFIETAYIPESDRKTLCVSSQVGCKMGCLFCMTGKQGFQANLTSAQILNQLVSIAEFSQLTNVVYMGMGEPLDNLEPVLSSLEVLTADWGLGFSQQKITVSSVGLLPALEEFFSRSKVRFALSLHSPFDEERASLMPVQNVHAMDDVLNFIRNRQESDVRRISIEYICFSGVNDTPRHTKELVRRLHGLKTRVNLIHFHPIPGTPLQGSDGSAMERMQRELSAKGIAATIRRSRGEDIWAACGLLSTKALMASTKS